MGFCNVLIPKQLQKHIKKKKIQVPSPETESLGENVESSPLKRYEWGRPCLSGPGSSAHRWIQDLLNSLLDKGFLMLFQDL